MVRADRQPAAGNVIDSISSLAGNVPKTFVEGKFNAVTGFLTYLKLFSNRMNRIHTAQAFVRSFAFALVSTRAELFLLFLEPRCALAKREVRLVELPNFEMLGASFNVSSS